MDGWMDERIARQTDRQIDMTFHFEGRDVNVDCYR